MESTLGGILLTYILGLSFLPTSTLASPSATTGTIALRAHGDGSICIRSTCGLGGQCFKEGSCFGARPPNHDNWSRCTMCVCPGQGFSGRTDPVS